jgi:hypothetical protein
LGHVTLHCHLVSTVGVAIGSGSCDTALPSGAVSAIGSGSCDTALPSGAVGVAMGHVTLHCYLVLLVLL